MHKLLFLFILFSSHCYAILLDDLTYSAEYSLSYRQFQTDNNKANIDQQLNGEGRFTIGLELENSKTFISAFGRNDFYDTSRNILNMDEAYYKYTADNWSISLGNHIFNWSVLEIFHPVDSINSRNLDSNANLIERLGQPSVVITREFESSILQFIPLLKTVAPIIPSARNRNGPQVYLENPKFVESDFTYTNSPHMPEGVIHYLHNFDSFDFDIHYARKYDTINPLIGSTYPTVEKVQATPYFLPVTQYGLAIQGTFEELIYKFEHIKYDFDNYKVCAFINCVNYNVTKNDYSLTAMGLEYSKNYANDHEGTYFFEYQTVLGTTIEQARLLNAFQRDIGFGYRHNFNNFDGHEIIVFIIHDVDHYKERIYSLSHSFRLGASWKWRTEVRVVEAEKPKKELALDNFSGLKPISESDNIVMKLTKFF